MLSVPPPLKGEGDRGWGFQVKSSLANQNFTHTGRKRFLASFADFHPFPGLPSLSGTGDEIRKGDKNANSNRNRAEKAIFEDSAHIGAYPRP